MSTAAQQRELYRARREAGLCANAAVHGPATRGSECEACWQRRAEKRRAAAVASEDLAALRREVATLRRELETLRMRIWGRR